MKEKARDPVAGKMEVVHTARLGAPRTGVNLAVSSD